MLLLLLRQVSLDQRALLQQRALHPWRSALCSCATRRWGVAEDRADLDVDERLGSARGLCWRSMCESYAPGLSPACGCRRRMRTLRSSAARATWPGVLSRAKPRFRFTSQRPAGAARTPRALSAFAPPLAWHPPSSIPFIQLAAINAPRRRPDTQDANLLFFFRPRAPRAREQPRHARLSLLAAEGGAWGLPPPSLG